jgi:hypothetical protein
MEAGNVTLPLHRHSFSKLLPGKMFNDDLTVILLFGYISFMKNALLRET